MSLSFAVIELDDQEALLDSLAVVASAKHTGGLVPYVGAVAEEKIGN